MKLWAVQCHFTMKKITTFQELGMPQYDAVCLTAYMAE
jgi:hypothetical protein